ncbi:M15 family metallopeptidase [Blastococcus sp. CT_GayMR16]|uniref:M15 family metallopeptidase n=1 Tax=Blastococcus sp. CT_GayMR16 TaxID=2559607 RepID=UPI0010733C98|nr:M15 family metallopeptidase [Blastococcus sp. CT_GayMR16]TFV91417.1 M15 family peptidase [Blastococcus sp. CT_GayMR16]
MVSSQNGFSANDRSQVETYLIGGKTKVALRKGAPGWLLQHLGNWFDANIRDIDPGILDDWGYAERPIRGGTELSNHASGTALDVDATKWPLGVEPTKYLTKDEIAKLKAHLTLYEGAIRWGGDYTGRKDPMHFEIDRDEAFCARIQAKLLAAPGYTPPSEEDPFMALTEAEQRRILGGIDAVKWLTDQIKPQTDRLEDEDAQTDVIAFIAENTQSAVGRIEIALYQMRAEAAAGAAAAGGLSAEEVRQIGEAAALAGLNGLRTVLREEIVAAVGEDNADQADAIVDALAGRLTSTE